jgi:hypothetical protein
MTGPVANAEQPTTAQPASNTAQQEPPAATEPTDLYLWWLNAKGEQAMRMTNSRSALMTVFRGCFDYSQQGKCLERATAAFLTLPGQLPST